MLLLAAGTASAGLVASPIGERPSPRPGSSSNSKPTRTKHRFDIDVEDDVATIVAIMKDTTDATNCTLECESVTQSITLPEPLPDGVRFSYPSDADHGCGGVSPSSRQPTHT